MGTWIKRHRTKYVFNHEVEGMDHMLEAVLCSGQPDPYKQQQIDAICLKGRDQHPSSDVRAVLNLAINWTLQGNTELQVSSGFRLFQSWAEHHVGALEGVLTRDLVSNLLTRPSRNQSNLPLLLTRALTLLQQHSTNAKLFQQLLKVVDAKAPCFLQESPELPCLKNLLQMLVTFWDSLPAKGGDLAARLVAPLLNALASNVIPLSPSMVPAFIRDVCTVTDILQQTWGSGGNTGNGNGTSPGILQDCLKELFKILSKVDGPEPSPCLGALVSLFPTEVVQSGIRTLATGDGCRLTEAGINCVLRRLLDWLVWPTCQTVDIWIITLLTELAAAENFSALITVTESKVEEVMEKLRYPPVREASFNILSHMLLGFQHSPGPFQKILPMVPEMLEVFSMEGEERSGLWRRRLATLLYYLIFLHTGFPDLYDPILDLIKDVPCPSAEEVSRRLAECRWSAQQPVINGNTDTCGCGSGSVGQGGSDQGGLELTGKKSDTGKVGLANLGNTCYMNSVLQTLFMCDEFRRQAVMKSPADEENLLKELQHVFATLILSQRPAWKPKQFLEASRPCWFARGQQQDCSEFLKYLLDQIHEQQLRSINRQIEEREVTKSPPIFTNRKEPTLLSMKAKSDRSSPQAVRVPFCSSRDVVASLPDSIVPEQSQAHDLTLVRRAFGFKVQSTFRCLTCQQQSQQVEDFLDIPLAFPETGSLGGSSSSSSLSQKTLVGGGSYSSQAGSLKHQTSKVDIALDLDSGGRGWGGDGGSSEDITKVTHLSQLLGHYLTAEPLMGDNQYHCDRCQTLQDGERTICLLEGPQYLILILLRFAFDTKKMVRSKVFREVTCPRTLAVHVEGKASNTTSTNTKKKPTTTANTTTTTAASAKVAKRFSRLLKHLQPGLSPSVPLSQDTVQLYGLCSVIVHSGASSECGHYYCYARHSKPRDVDSVLDSLDRGAGSSKNNTTTPSTTKLPATELEEDFLEDDWCLFNDERVTRATYTSFSKLTQRYPSDTPYMLVYKRLSLDTSTTTQGTGATSPAASLLLGSDILDVVPRDVCEAVRQDNSAFVKEQEEAARMQTGRSRSTSVTLDTWQDTALDTASLTTGAAMESEESYMVSYF